MNCKASILFVLTFVLLLAQTGIAQTPGTQPNPDLTQLIAWSQLQNPDPVPQPKRDPASVPGAPQEQPRDRQQPGQPANTDAQKQSAETMTGTIVNEDGRYVLKASDNKTYQIDDQVKAKQYEGKQVKIVGSVDASARTIRIGSIEPAS